MANSFDFKKLRIALNQTIRSENTALDYNGSRCRQIFSINYGIVEYVEWDKHQENASNLPNPIKYTYLKDKKFSAEKELRISLSALGIGHYVQNGVMMDFPDSFPFGFDFKAAIADGTIEQILYLSDCDSDFLLFELNKLHIAPSDRSNLSLHKG